MLIVLMIVSVLIGLAYADYCLVDNTAHFGICYMKIAEAEEERAEKREGRETPPPEPETQAVRSLRFDACLTLPDRPPARI